MNAASRAVKTLDRSLLPRLEWWASLPFAACAALTLGVERISSKLSDMWASTELVSFFISPALLAATRLGYNHRLSRGTLSIIGIVEDGSTWIALKRCRCL